MIKIDLENGNGEILGTPVVISKEIGKVIEHINETLDTQNNILRDSMEELVVLDDNSYQEICKFAYRMNNAHKKVDEMKKAHPELFDKDISLEESTEHMKKTLNRLLKELIEKFEDLDKK